MSTRDRTEPKGKWEFDSQVTEAFDDMLQRSIPQYDVMRQAVTDIASAYQRDKGWIVDLGCSRGGAIAPLLERFGAYNHFVGVEVSEPMLEAARERFKGWIDAKVVEIRKEDLRTEYPRVPPACVTLCVLALQFTPIEYRPAIMKRIYDHTAEDGALVMVEKVLGSHGSLDELLVKTYLARKAEAGYTQEQIDRKRLSLEGVLVPITAKWNEDLLRDAGFRHVECFWRWMNFAGWVAVK